jgi:rod shape-determining protein MreC
MWSPHHSQRRIRSWIAPLSALVLALGLTLLPRVGKERAAWLLERSVFYPFRFAVGWGPRSLTAEREAAQRIRALTEAGLARDQALEVLTENTRLRRLLGFGRRTGLDFVPAQVVGNGREELGDVLMVRPERPTEVEPGMPVICPEGLIGLVASRRDPYVQVEGLAHEHIAVSVLNQRSREGGILKWRPERGTMLGVEGIPGQSDWLPGDRVVSSGLGAAFPSGLLVGWVTGVTTRPGGVLKVVWVHPAASIARSGEVFVLRSRPGDMVGAAAADLSGLYPPEPWSSMGRVGVGGIGREAGAVPAP